MSGPGAVTRCRGILWLSSMTLQGSTAHDPFSEQWSYPFLLATTNSATAAPILNDFANSPHSTDEAEHRPDRNVREAARCERIVYASRPCAVLACCRKCGCVHDAARSPSVCSAAQPGFFPDVSPIGDGLPLLVTARFSVPRRGWLASSAAGVGRR